MAANAPVNWSDLDSKGFVHVPGFLSTEELAASRADYTGQPMGDADPKYAISAATERGLGPVRARIESVMADVRAQTRIRVDHIIGGGFFSIKRGVLFGWHQDHESYFECQNHSDYLNFYMPIFKPVAHKSNLCIVPFDALARECPRTFRSIVGRGASSTIALGGRQLVMQDDAGTTHLTRVDLETLACTPQLSAGDLLLMRGDILHRTQDTDTDRVALSIRAAHGATMVSRARLADGGIAKASYMARNDRTYARLFQAFERAGQDQLCLADLLAEVNRLKQEPQPDDGWFKSRLLKEKLRGGVMLSSIRKVVGETIVRRLVTTYHARARPR
jgi:hypothetical protein